jgi:hypothetical protein
MPKMFYNIGHRARQVYKYLVITNTLAFLYRPYMTQENFNDISTWTVRRHWPGPRCRCWTGGYGGQGPEFFLESMF